MSRTKKGKPSPGKEYWGKRPGLGYGAFGKSKSKREAKRIGIKNERAILKQELYKKVNGPKKYKE